MASQYEAIRPETYYGDGEFDPPSSDDEADVLLEKNGPSSPGIAEQGQFDTSGPALTVGGSHKQRSTSLRVLVISLGILVFIAACIGTIAAGSYNGVNHRLPGAKHITMDHIFNGTFSASSQSVHWVPEAGDGVFSVRQDGEIKLTDLKTNETSTLVRLADIQDEHGRQLYWSEWQLSPDMKYILLKADRQKQWRWSSHGNYYVHNLHTSETHPIVSPTNPPLTAYAAWSPTGDSIAYVLSNDLYILPTASPAASPIRVTNSGNASLFHGVPDWVYEEEVFSADYALWWAPDSSRVAFMRFDETEVPTYSFPIYNPGWNASDVVPYTADVVMKYPKPGYNNPLVSVHVFDFATYKDEAMSQGFPAGNQTYELTWDGRFDPKDSVLMELKWVANASLILKEVSRNGGNGSVVMFDLSHDKNAGKIVRRLGKDGEEGDDGWIESSQNIYPLPSSVIAGGDSAYLDIVPTKEGFNHIALFSPASSDKPRFLTSGNWEVTAGILGVDLEKGLVYFQAANPSSIERHIYSVPLPTLSAKEGDISPTALTEPTSQAFYSASFSPRAGFYLLSYKGPNVPYQTVVQVNNTDFSYPLTTNMELNETLAIYETPVVTYSTIEVDGFELNVKEIRPPRMDDSGRTKYPVLFSVYGGPGSQMVDLRYNRDWHYYVACGLKYIVVKVDGRGTGFKGRKLRNVVKGNLGFWETKDQIAAAKIWAAKDYVDPTRIGVWGWSYGGFMAAKVAEAGEGIHSLAMSVAPVTSWRLYDSIYTERYMGSPVENPGGYVNASISDVSAFDKVDFLLAHGSGDDNVHFANSAHLLDMLTQAQSRRFRFRMFTDSDHGINKRGGYREIFEFLTEFVVEKWGKGGRRRGW